MTNQNVAILRKDIINLLNTTNDFEILKKIKSLLSLENQSLRVNDSGVEYLTMTEKEIINQALLAEEEIKNGMTISQEQAYNLSSIKKV